MKVLNREVIKESGFGGIRERRIVTDSRLFGPRKKPKASEGYGQFIYLADANYQPNGESGMHSHEEVDIITVILDGRVAHEGSLEHGKNLDTGDIQVQRAGGEGFSHNEKNPDQKHNRILQIWALPEERGLPASYKFYSPKNGVTRIYGGPEDQKETFSSSTTVDFLILKKGESFAMESEVMTYLAEGQANANGNEDLIEGDLNIFENVKISAKEDLKLVLIQKQGNTK